MVRFTFCGVAALACLAAVSAFSSAKALMVAPSPLPNRVAGAKVILVGKVTKIEEKTVMAVPYKGAKEKVEYKIAVVKVEENVAGVKGLTEAKIGFIAPPMGGGKPIRPFRGVVLAEGQEACFFLQPHPEEAFYLINMAQETLDKKAQDFDKQLTEVKKCVKLLEKPLDGLKSKDKDERFTTAGLLLARYRTYRGTGGANPKQEGIDAEESKLIMQALAEADWGPQRDFNKLNATQMFYQLGATKEDGWEPPKTPEERKKILELMQKWVKDNADKYRIKKFVEDDGKK